MTDVASIEKETLKCSQCSKEFKFPTGLGSHMRRVHGIAGTSKSSLSYKKQNKNKISKRKLPITKGVLDNVSKTKNETEPETITFFNDPIAYFIAVGSLKEFCRNLAKEHGIPETIFTSGCAKLFYDQTRR